MQNQVHTKSQARKIGYRKALKYTLLVYLSFEVWILYHETKGDFANGILFFIQEQLNSLVLSVVLLSILSSFVFGRSAGKKILADGKNPILIAGMFTISSCGVLMGYLFLLSWITTRAPVYWGGVAIGMFTLSLAIWSPTVWSIKRTGSKGLTR
jgi:hypothetical protein